MKTAVVNFKTTPEVKKRAQTFAKSMGLSLSFLLNQQLRHIAQAKSIKEMLEPSDWLKQQLKESAEDEKAGWVSPGFNNADDAITWLNDKNRKYQNGYRDQ